MQGETRIRTRDRVTRTIATWACCDQQRQHVCTCLPIDDRATDVKGTFRLYSTVLVRGRIATEVGAVPMVVGIS